MTTYGIVVSQNNFFKFIYDYYITMKKFKESRLLNFHK